MHIPIQRTRAFTLVELLVVLAFLFILAALIDFGPTGNAKRRALRVQCVNYLKQDGLAFRIWSRDQAEAFPMQRSMTNRGTKEFTSGPFAYRHFQILSNELATPKVLLCPDDYDRWIAATNFVWINNSNLSYFVGIDADETNVMMILSGDHHLTNGTAIENGLIVLTTNAPAGWTSQMHHKVGNVLLTDGSVQQVSMTGLRYQIANTGVATNRVQMPVLGQ